MLNMEEQKRQAILQKAKEWIVVNGLSDFTMGKLASACNVAKGTLYNYFSNKEELMLRIVEESVNVIHKEVERILSTSDKPEKKLENLIRSALTFYIDNMDLLMLYGSEVTFAECKRPSMSTTHGTFLKAHMEWFLDSFDSFLESLGVVRERRLMAYLFHEMLDNLMLYNVFFEREQDIERDTRILYSLFTRGLEAFNE